MAIRVAGKGQQVAGKPQLPTPPVEEIEVPEATVEIPEQEEAVSEPVAPTDVPMSATYHLKTAVDFLDAAIDLHAGHMTGTAEVSDESQQELMDLLVNARKELWDDGEEEASELEETELQEPIEELEGEQYE